MNDDYTYPNPLYNIAELGRKLNLDALPDPPKGYRFLGYTSLCNWAPPKRRPRAVDLARWCDFYLWGFQIDLKNRVKDDLEGAIQKVMYYTADKHRPPAWDDFVGFKWDAGPRLIDYTKIPWERPVDQLKEQGLWYAPVSRFYPTLPNRFTQTSQGFQRPAVAPKEWDDAWVEQTFHSSEPMFDPANPAQPWETYSSTFALPGATVNPPVQPAARLAAQQPAGGNALHPNEIYQVREAVERAIMKFAYSDLERHPTASLREPPRNHVATSADEILQATIGSSMAISHVRLSEDPLGKLYIDRGGILAIVRGRGPEFSRDSAVMDCVITVGKLLDAGSTNADRKDPQWSNKFKGLQRLFIELCDVNWDLCTPNTGAQMKEQFRVLILQTKPNFGDNNLEEVSFLWDAVGQSLGQFAVTFDHMITPCQCAGGLNTVGKRTDYVMVPPVRDPAVDSQGVTMQELFRRSFMPLMQTKCCNCGQADAVRLQRCFHQLPLRLAVRVPPTISVLNHTTDVTFSYRQKGALEKDMSATYRWLGGIYYDGGSYRVFWNDTKRGEIDNKKVCMYESSNHGLITAGDVAANVDDRVPPRWWNNKRIPLLFYEHVLNPSRDILTVAARTVNQVCADSIKGNLILKNQRWATASETRPYQTGYPWQPLEVEKPLDAQYFYTALNAQAPSFNQAANMAPPQTQFDMNHYRNNSTYGNTYMPGAMQSPNTSTTSGPSRPSTVAGPSRTSSISTVRGTFPNNTGLTPVISHAMLIDTPQTNNSNALSALNAPVNAAVSGEFMDPDTEMNDSNAQIDEDGAEDEAMAIGAELRSKRSKGKAPMRQSTGGSEASPKVNNTDGGQRRIRSSTRTRGVAKPGTRGGGLKK
ncbi:hypothetical protein BDW59DRAFT_109521 [Aspergillus cavernicola]|uniref:Uncharacterized protein n=1 Tax=Aspergillus cavernicola TaxID=176166 RepID=A0ABR4I0W3_9EURO